MSPVLALTLAALIGAVASAQPFVNAALAKSVQSPLVAALISLSVSATLAVCLVLAFGTSALARASLASVPWWGYLGGVIGLMFVGGALLLAPVAGALAFFVCLVAGQLAGATAIDHFGLFGAEVRPADPARLAGLALVFAGVVLVQRG
ncbi:MAG: DMT family transporter [Paracoccaceae bacterium]